jgi:hypothetical protein
MLLLVYHLMFLLRLHTGGRNLHRKKFMKFPLVANFIKHFKHKLHYYQHIALGLD